jgi:hypothetical protein
MIETEVKESIVLGKREGGEYTAFRNTNQELVEKIKAVTIPEDTFENWDGVACTIESKTPDGQLLCKDSKGKSLLVSESEYKTFRKHEKLNKINRLYPVSKYFNEQFGYYFGEKVIIVGGHASPNYDALGKINVSESKFKPYFSEDGSISVGVCLSPQMVGFHFCYFDEDGNYVNRDYNLDLKRHLKERPAITKNELIEKVSAAIPGMKYMYSEKKGIWFTDSFAYTLDINIDEKEKYFNFNLQRVPVKENGKFGKQYTKQFAMPKTGLVDSSKNDIMERIIPVINKLRLK